MCVCVCACVRMRVCACVYICVYGRALRDRFKGLLACAHQFLQTHTHGQTSTKMSKSQITHLGIRALHALPHPHRRDQQVLVRLEQGWEKADFPWVGGGGGETVVDREGGGEDGVCAAAAATACM
jgi:hypothetical protein